jgi:DNA-binding LacI/PurR family transcriptional regulator
VTIVNVHISPAPAKRVTILDVAAAAGVSRQTVVRAIQDQPGINAATKANVIEIVEQMGYVPSIAAQSMAGQPTRILALIIGRLRNPFNSEFADAFRQASGERGKSFLLPPRARRGEWRPIAHLLKGMRVDGAVVFPSAASPEDLDQIADASGAMCVINPLESLTNFTTLTLDEIRAVELATSHIQGLGRRRVGIIGHSPGPMHPRVHLLEEAFGVHAISPDAVTERDGYDAAQRLLTDRPDIDTIVAFADTLGLGAVRAVTVSGRRIAEDVAVLGFDDTDAAAYSPVALTSIGVHPSEMASRSLDLLTAPGGTHSILTPEIHVRESSVADARGR